MPITYLPAEQHVVRYVPWSRLRKDEDDNVIGVLGVAFKLRDSERYLSATWVEFFPGDHHGAVAAAVRAIRGSSIDVKTRSGFAVGNVGRIKETCASHNPKYKIRIIHEEEADNRAHAALRGWPREDDELLELLSEDPWSETVLNRDIAP